MMQMKTMQGIASRRRAVMRFLRDVALYALLFALVVAAARALVWPALSELIADLTSVWVEVPEDTAEYYRLLGYQEGMQVNGMATFRDLRDYRLVRDVLTGPVLWGCFALGLAGVSLGSVLRGVHETDELAAALSRVAAGDDLGDLPDGLASARGEFGRLEERMAARERAARDAETRKNELVAYLAHDIKTPLTSVIGYLALLAEEPGLSEERRGQYAAAALDKAQRLDGMMDEFFEITRYNLCAIPIERERVDAVMLMGQVADELMPVAMERGVKIAVSGPDDGAVAFIDPEKMARTLGNIVRNAVSFADRDSVIECAVRREGEHGERTVFSVSDTGKEISASHLTSIFEKFYREDSARGTRRGGAGLGLAIAREIVEAHGGVIAAASEAGVTTFTVEVPTDRG